MRMHLLAALAALPLLGGCQTDCGPLDQYNGTTYRTFANPVTWDSNNTQLQEGPEFWSYGMPINGVSDWSIRWGASEVGPMTVLINGQEFEGEGDMDATECGQAVVDFSGVYADTQNGVDHTFNASMSLSHWTDNLGSQLGAFVIWKENWSHPSSANGTVSATSHLTGSVVGGDGGTAPL